MPIIAVIEELIARPIYETALHPLGWIAANRDGAPGAFQRVVPLEQSQHYVSGITDRAVNDAGQTAPFASSSVDNMPCRLINPLSSDRSSDTFPKQLPLPQKSSFLASHWLSRVPELWLLCSYRDMDLSYAAASCDAE